MMETLLDADYTVRDDKVIVRLFYKTENGREIREVADFNPYFYAIPEDDIDKLTEEVKTFDRIKSVEKKTMQDIHGEIEVLRLNVKLPRDVPNLRGEIKELDHCREVREADVPFAHRYIIDSGLVPMENCEELDLRIATFDLEVYNPRGEPDSDRDEIIMISYADSMGLMRVWSTKGGDLDLDYVEVLDSEREMIKKFIRTVKEREIDIVTSYNGDNFDFPYLKDRGAKYGIEIDLGLEGSPVRLERRGMRGGAKIKGRPHVDMFPIARQVFNLPRYRLEDVYLEVSGEEKLDIEVGTMAGVWDSGCGDKFREFFEYSMSDSKATLELSMALLPLQYELARVVRLPIYECSRTASGQRVEHLLVRGAFSRGIIVPNKPSDRIAEERRRKSYVGAYVVEPKRGIHDNILLFDFRSLYPSIVISHNIDVSTIDCGCCLQDGFKSPTGHHFCRRNQGFIPEVLGGLIEKRMRVKEDIKGEGDQDKRRFLGVEQQALKLLANSMYGYFGFPRARWYSRECAEAIAALGRQFIHKTIEKVEEYGFDVIYGDTDSVYIAKPGVLDTEKIISDARVFLEEINEELPQAMELEFEGFYPRGIFITKKRYALMDEHGMLIVKGLETRRRDWANVAKETQEGVLNAILRDRDPQKAADIVRDVVDRIRGGDVPLSDLAINTQVTRGLGDYVQAGPHVVAARKAVKRGREFKPGNIVTYIVTKKGASISDRAQVIDFVTEGDYDPDYYINNQVLPAVMRILEALGYSEDELKGLGKQMTLGSF